MKISKTKKPLKKYQSNKNTGQTGQKIFDAVKAREDAVFKKDSVEYNKLNEKDFYFKSTPQEQSRMLDLLRKHSAKKLTGRSSVTVGGDMGYSDNNRKGGQIKSKPKSKSKKK
jgi:hypothetical protein